MASGCLPLNPNAARRGQSDRNEAIRTAIDHAERDFAARYGFGRGGRDDWQIRVSTPKNDSCLQAVDYFLWAVQRFFEPRAGKEKGEAKREERFLKVIWPQVGEIHDLHFGPDRGTFFNGQQPLTLEVRFGEQKTNVSEKANARESGRYAGTKRKKP